MMIVPALSVEDLQEEAKVQVFCEALSEHLLTPQDKTVGYDVFMRQDPERGFFIRLCVAPLTVLHRTRYWEELFGSAEYLALRHLGIALGPHRARWVLPAW